MLTIKRWEDGLQGAAKAALERILPDILATHRWFSGKARIVRSATIQEAVPFAYDSSHSFLTFILVEYSDGHKETYDLPLALAVGERASKVWNHFPSAVIAEVQLNGGLDTAGILYDALWNQGFLQSLLKAIGQNQHVKAVDGDIVASPTKTFRNVMGEESRLAGSVMAGEQSNTSVVYGDRVILKLYRRLEESVNPDLEIGRVLTELAFPSSPPVAGAIEYHRKDGETITLAVLRAFVQNQGDAWRYTLNSLEAYFGKALAGQAEIAGAESGKPLLALIEQETPLLACQLIGSYLQAASLLGQRTAELHTALSEQQGDPRFAPEPFSASYQQSRYDSMCRLTGEVFQLLRQRVADFPDHMQQEAQQVLDLEGKILARFRAFLDLRSGALRIRCHGDYHLGQVLYTGDDFVIVDFEGEPARPIRERRTKHSPLIDVAGMLRSFDYAPYAALFAQRSAENPRWQPFDASLEAWAAFWSRWVGTAFLRAYRRAAVQAPFWPRSQGELRVLLGMHLLEKSVYELGYELNNRPDWVSIPLRGMCQIIESEK